MPLGVGVGVGVDPETMTCAVAVTLTPAAFIAVKVYTVVADGITTLLPAKATLPIPWSMLAVLAPETDQLSVEDSPAAMLGGLAPKEFIAADWVVVVKLIPDKSQPAVRVSITVNITNGINFFTLHLQKRI